VTQPADAEGRQTVREALVRIAFAVCVISNNNLPQPANVLSLSLSLSVARTEIFIGLVKMRIVCGAAAFNAGRGRWVHSSF